MEMGDYWPAIVGNLHKSRGVLVRLLRILVREGAYARILGSFYFTAIQSTLFWGSERWVVTPIMAETLEIFRCWVHKGSWYKYPGNEQAVVDTTHHWRT